MSVIFPIVEGHGEVRAIPEIIRRIAYERENATNCSVLPPYRLPRGKIVRFGDDLYNVVEYGQSKLSDYKESGGILILIDADDDCPVMLRNRFETFRAERNLGPTASFISSKMEYEAWFISCVEELRGHRDIRQDATSHPNPEIVRHAKGYFNNNILIDGVNYSETVDQVKYSAMINIDCVRERCRSFEKFCKEVESLIIA